MQRALLSGARRLGLGASLVRNLGQSLQTSCLGPLEQRRLSSLAAGPSARTLETARLPLLPPTPSLPVVYHPLYSAPQLAKGHRFPMQVFRRIYEILLADGLVTEDQVWTPDPITDQRLSLALSKAHDAEYLQAFLSGTLNAAALRRIGFGEVASSRDAIDRTVAECAGTLLTAELALRLGLAVNTAGGTHHAQRDTGSGFCILNDLAATSISLLERKLVERVLILDLDVHQGDGTASILSSEPRAFTLSVHCESNFPARKAASTLDIGLADGVGDDEYLGVVSDALPRVLSDFRPDLVLYDAGVDVHEEDSLGRLSISDDGLARREALVLDTCLAAGVPVAGYVGGGYAEDLSVLARRHIWLHRAAIEMWEAYGLGTEAAWREHRAESLRSGVPAAEATR